MLQSCFECVSSRCLPRNFGEDHPLVLKDAVDCCGRFCGRARVCYLPDVEIITLISAIGNQIADSHCTTTYSKFNCGLTLESYRVAVYSSPWKVAA
jgi:hypothetical protein